MLNDFSWIIRSSFQFSPAWSQHVWLPFLPFLRLEQAFNISNFNKYNKAFKQWWIQHRQVIFYRKMAAHRKKEDKILLRTIHKFHSLIDLKRFFLPLINPLEMLLKVSNIKLTSKIVRLYIQWRIYIWTKIKVYLVEIAIGNVWLLPVFWIL